MTDLTDVEKKVIAFIQGDMPVTERPYREIADTLGMTEDSLLDIVKDLCERGLIRRFGATLRHQKSGFEANVMVAWQVDEAQIDAAGEIMAGFSEVSHCYRRDPADEWPYNLYTMIHAQDESSCREIVRKLSAETSLYTYTLLFSRRELKKTSMQYFGSS